MENKALQVATWNVNSIRVRLPVIEQWLKETSPDIVLLQETKTVDENFPREALEDRGYNLALFGQKTYNGVAILSKFPIEDVVEGLPTLGEEQEARYIEAFTGGMRVASIYVPNGESVGSEKYAKKERFFKALAAHAATLLQQNEKLVLGGDYNVAPSDADVYDPKKWKERILCSTPERCWFRDVLYKGFIDPMAKSMNPSDPNPFTWWDYRTRGFDSDAGLRIDHLLLSPQASDALESVRVDRDTRGWERPSDHAPVVASFER